VDGVLVEFLSPGAGIEQGCLRRVRGWCARGISTCLLTTAGDRVQAEDVGGAGHAHEKEPEAHLLGQGNERGEADGGLVGWLTAAERRYGCTATTGGSKSVLIS
jgi:hypothetical protein